MFFLFSSERFLFKSRAEQNKKRSFNIFYAEMQRNL